MSDHEYSHDFYSYIDAGSRRSARAVASILLPEMKITSLLDVGAGHGAWAAEWLAAGVKTVVAVDGDYVQADQLAIPKKNFRAHDLSTPLDLKKSFDLVQTLEVAEHLPEGKAELFVDNLTRHGDVILFSAAVPHQGGEHHVNEQPPEYWREKFASRGYAAFDFVRPKLQGQSEVMPWYRFNSYVYANAAGQKRLSKAMLASRVPDSQPLEIGGDFAWMLRRAAVRLIPTSLVKPVAMAKATIEARLKR
ncbi:class I SAM-dependent methyltransferase [Sphingomonas alba]|uniref:Methyltransferase domain-containing protein n=1 Tax=Sphingomonas alba TaxID=2908208 RepID=A0ABT0RM61_9SPHN|nr:class I SAM-dependent methyltransferase [Sphingomonas alba]MCL6683736.1 methyltransferase domain-containing protein [Sphingomonas alba]